MVLGHTGSGKTVAGVSHLAFQDFHVKPWVIVNTKGDKHLNSIRGAVEWTVNRPPPTKPGIYQIRPNMGDDDEELQLFMRRSLAQENVGFYIDEGYAVAPSRPVNIPFRNIMTQGRSKNMAVIINSQRPSWIDRFVISEADFFQVFHLNDSDDHKTIKRFVPPNPRVFLKTQSTQKFETLSLEEDLPLWHSLWYDVTERTGKVLIPSRPPEESVLIIDKRLDEIRQTDNTVRRLKV